MLSGLLPSARFDADHETFRETVRRFVDKAVMPNIDAWEEAETFPRALYREAADLGLLGIGFPEEYGGTPGDLFLELAMIEELTRAASGGLLASLFSHTIGAPPIVAGGSAELKARVLAAILSGEKISALAITEPSGGSDVANLSTRAVRDGDHYIVNGSKTFITSGMRADGRPSGRRSGARLPQVGVHRSLREGVEQRRCAGRPRDGPLGRQAEMPEDPADDGRLLDERDQAQAAAASRTRQHLEPERPAHQVRPAGLPRRGRCGCWRR